jgi:hypothetical protein
MLPKLVAAFATSTEPSGISADYIDTFEVDGSVEGVKDLLGSEK